MKEFIDTYKAFKEEGYKIKMYEADLNMIYALPSQKLVYFFLKNDVLSELEKTLKGIENIIDK